MRTYKPNSHIEFDIFADMLYEYIKELHELEPNVELRTKQQLIEEYFYTTDTDFLLLSANDTTVGFAIVGYGTNCHSNTDIYIEEFYIKPEYRRQGYAKYFAKEIIKDVDSVCFFEIKSNIVAKTLWSRVFADWIDSTDIITDTSNAPEWVNWFAFKRGK